MKKYIYFIILIILIFVIITNSYEIVESIKFSFNLCINNLFPSFIPFMLLSNFLISYNFTDELSNIFEFLMKKFKVNKNSSIIFIMSLFSGSPTNAIYINNLLINGLINLEDASNCLNFCHFANPIFILNTIGYSFLGSKEIGLKILIAHYLSSIIIGLFNKRKSDYIINYKKDNKEKDNFMTVLKKSILNTSNSLLLIIGIITFFIIITTIIDTILNINENYKFIYGFIEMTQGLKFLSLSNFTIKIKAIISVFLISFGGLSIHLQVFNIINNKKIRYIPYLFSRISHAILACLILLLIIH